MPAGDAHTSWGLPAAFLTAGARSVIGALTLIPDADATSFFAGVVADIERGDAVTVAVARHRATALQRDPTSWVRHVVVFE